MTRKDQSRLQLLVLRLASLPEPFRTQLIAGFETLTKDTEDRVKRLETSLASDTLAY